MVGDSPLEFSPDGDILINNVRYRSKEGLYELLFKRIPDEEKYDNSDLNAYRNVLLKTSAHKKGYERKGPINRNASKKYKEIISKLFPPPYVSGKGMMWKNTRSRDIVHWDDPNELVGRLEHIAMSTETGNRVHSNEILSIIEELREAGYIKGAGKSCFKSLLQ